MAGPIPKIAVIAGPTGSGKTNLAISLALELDGEIVNADSMQVYKGMDVGTAKPTKDEMRGVKHHLLDEVRPDEEFNAAIYRERAFPIIQDITSRGKLCLVVGGTGLYIKALKGGLFRCPPVDKNLREKLKMEASRLGSAAMYEALRRLDPACALAIHPNDLVRILRALEVAALTGRRPSELAAEHSFKDNAVDALIICLSMDRRVLYDRINRRCAEMIERGLLEETRRLLKKGYSPELKPMKAIGYRHMISHIVGGVPLEAAVAKMKTDTRRYAKRQLTWFRAELDALWLSPDDFSSAAQAIVDFMGAKKNWDEDLRDIDRGCPLLIPFLDGD